MKNRNIELATLIYKNANIPYNEVCIQCSAKLKEPLITWIIGDKYPKTYERIMFIGKPHRGEPGQVTAEGLINPNECLESDLMNSAWPYWNYTKAIIQRIFGLSDPWNNIVFTNIVKCTNSLESSDSRDRTNIEMAINCIKRNGIIHREIEHLKPRNIVFYTYNLYRDLLEELPFIKTIISEERGKRECGEKTIGWWSREANAIWNEKVRILVTSHPERKKKTDYVNLLYNWITA